MVTSINMLEKNKLNLTAPLCFREWHAIQDLHFFRGCSYFTGLDFPRPDLPLVKCEQRQKYCQIFTLSLKRSLASIFRKLNHACPHWISIKALIILIHEIWEAGGVEYARSQQIGCRARIATFFHAAAVAALILSWPFGALAHRRGCYQINFKRQWKKTCLRTYGAAGKCSQSGIHIYVYVMLLQSSTAPEHWRKRKFRKWDQRRCWRRVRL